MQNIKCGGCGKVFSSTEAVCIDWSDPKKSCICPNCDRALQPGKIELTISVKRIAAQAFVAGFVAVFFYYLMRNFSGNSLYALMALTLAVFIGLAYYFRKPEQIVERIPYESV